MATKLCMFCEGLIDPDQLTTEHFVPKGLWEKGHRPEGMKTLPAHKACNEAFSEDNEYFRDVMAMEDGVRQHPEAQRVQSGAIRRKFARRFGSLVNTLKNLRVQPVRTLSGIHLGTHPTFEVDRQRIERVLVNVMKGIFYISQRRPLPQTFVTAVFDVVSLRPEVVSTAASFMVPWQSFGDSTFRCRYAVSSKEPIQKMACLMQFYGRRAFLGEAISPDLLGGEEQFVPVNEGSAILVPPWTADR